MKKYTILLLLAIWHCTHAMNNQNNDPHIRCRAREKEFTENFSAKIRAQEMEISKLRSALLLEREKNNNLTRLLIEKDSHITALKKENNALRTSIEKLSPTAADMGFVLVGKDGNE